MKILLLIVVAVALHAQPVHNLCQACHSEQVEDFLTHPHATKSLSCDACHGKSIKHREASGGAPPDRVAGPQEVPGLCGTCHAPIKKLFDTSKHAAVLAEASRVRAPSCGTCHGVHARNTLKQIEVRCSRCHEQLPAVCKADAGGFACDPHTLAKAAKK